MNDDLLDLRIEYERARQLAEALSREVLVTRGFSLDGRGGFPSLPDVAHAAGCAERKAWADVMRLSRELREAHRTRVTDGENVGERTQVHEDEAP